MRHDVESFVAGHVGCPPAAGLWVFRAGMIHGIGNSHYHWHPDYVCLHILSRGKGFLQTPGESRDLSSGDMFTLWPGIEIDYGQNPDDPWEVYFIHLMGPHARAFGEELGFNDQKSYLRPLHPIAAVNDFTEIFERMKEAGGDEIDYDFQAVLYRMIGHCRRRGGSGPPQSSPQEKLVERACLLIGSQLNTGININETLESLRVGRTTLFNAFKKVRGISPMQYLTDCRIDKAKMLLRERRYPLPEIAKKIGFKSLDHFLKRFKSVEGIAVREWLDRDERENKTR